MTASRLRDCDADKADHARPASIAGCRDVDRHHVVAEMLGRLTNTAAMRIAPARGRRHIVPPASRISPISAPASSA